MKAPRAISNSQLSAFKKSPAHWLHYITKEREQTDAMLLGSVAHCLALEKAEFENTFFMLDVDSRPEPTKDFRNAKNRDWKMEQMSGVSKDLTIVSSAIVTQAKNMVEALYTNHVSRKYMQEGKEFESELKWSCLGLDFMGIRDITSDEFIADLKFVSNADPFAFQRTLFKDGIYRQGGMYLDGEMNGEFTGDPHKRILFIAVEQAEPHGVSVHELDLEVITFGINEYRMLASQLKTCLDNDYFPSYDHRSIDGTFTANLPTFIATE